MERIKFWRKQTATATPELERAIAPKAEKRKKRGTNKRLLHIVRPEDISGD
jgi:hypothetical protein